MTQDEKRQLDDFLRPQLQSKYYERTGYDLEANKTVKNYYPLVKDIYDFLRKEERYFDQNIELVDQEKEDGKIKRAGMSLVSANNLKSLIGQQRSVGDATYPILLDYVGYAINLEGIKEETLQQLYTREGVFGITSYKTKLEKRGIKEADDWHIIRKVVLNNIKKGKVKQLCCLAKGYDAYLEALLTNRLADRKVIFTFFNTLNYFLALEKKQKSAIDISEIKEEFQWIINRYKGEIKTAKKKIKDQEASNDERVKAENVKKDYERRLQNIFIEDYSERFIGKKITTKKAIYTITKQLHKGKFSVVWKATANWKEARKDEEKNGDSSQPNPQQETAVVIKMLRSTKNIGFKNQVIEGVKVQKEAYQLLNQDLAKKEQGGVVKVCDGPHEEQGFTFFVMEYVDGQTIEEWLKEQKEKAINKEVFLANFKAYFRGLCYIVNTLHKNNIQHLDIAPDNVYITKSGNILLSDFDNVQFKGHHYNSSLNYLEMASSDFLPDTLKKQKELSIDKAKQADIYALSRIMMNAFLVGIGQEEGWQGNRHDNENTINGPRFKPYQQELKNLLQKGTQFEGATVFKNAEELMQEAQLKLAYRQSPRYQQLDLISKILALTTVFAGIAIGLLMWNMHQSKHIKGLGYYISANTSTDLDHIQDFTSIYQPTFINAIAELQKSMLSLNQDTTLAMQLDVDVVAAYQNDNRAPYEENCTLYGPLATRYKFCYEYGTLTPTKTLREQLEKDSIKQVWLKYGTALFGNLHQKIQQRMEAVPTKGEEVTTHLSTILDFEQEGKIKPILLYAIIETATDSIMYRYPFYSKDLSTYHFPTRPWYQAITDKTYGNQPIYLPQLQQAMQEGWTVGISPLYPDIKAGFLPIRTLFFEKKEKNKRYLLLIDFMYKV